MQDAIDAAAGFAERVVYIPAGKCTWSGAPISVGGDIRIFGAGKGHFDSVEAEENATKLFLSPDPDSTRFFNFGNSSFIRVSGIGFYAMDREICDIRDPMGDGA